MFGIIIDIQGYKKEFVCLDEVGDIKFYKLKDGEKLILQDWQIANGMGKPKWTGVGWVDEEPPKQIDICPPKSTEQKLEKENNQLWDTVNFLLKADGYIPSESEV